MNGINKKKLIDELEREAEKLHNSTRTDIPFLSPVHNFLRSKSPIYYNWATAPKSRTIHKAGTIAFIVSFLFFVGLQAMFPDYFSGKPRESKGVSFQLEGGAAEKEVSWGQYKAAREKMKDIQPSPDGKTTTAKVYGEPVQYLADDGTWKDVDTSIKTTANAPGEKVSNQKDKPLSVTDADYKSHFSTNLQADLRIDISDQYFINSFPEAANSPAVIEGNKATYKDVYPKTDIERIFHGGAVKQNIILKEAGHPTEFKEKIDSSLRVEIQKDNSINYYKDKKRVATTPPIKVIGKGTKTDKNRELPVTLKMEGNILTITLPDTKLLKYPLAVDPTTNIYGVSGDDTWVYSYDYYGPQYDNFPTDTSLRAGYYDLDRSYLRFSLSGVSGTISAATLNLYWSQAASAITLKHSAPMNPGTDAGSTLWGITTDRDLYSNFTPTAGQYNSYNTNLTDTQNDKTSYNYTYFQLHGFGAQYGSINSADNASNKPYLAVTYAAIPDAPTGFGGSALSTTSVRWSWTDASSNETGFRVHDASHAVKCTVGAGVTTCDEGSLAANTAYTRHVHAYNGDGDSAASNEATKYTSAVNPNVTSDKTANIWYNTTGVTFTNAAGFGAGSLTKYKYIWDQTATQTASTINTSGTDWSSGTLSKTMPPGDNYLHVTSYNGDTVQNTTVGNYGPYKLDPISPTASVVVKDKTTGATDYVGSARSVKTVITASDAGTPSSGLYQVQLSNDGTTWGTQTDANGVVTDSGSWANWDASFATTGYPSTGDWYVTTGDGSKRVYAKVKDTAGNISGKNWTTTADFNGATGSNINTANDEIKINPNGSPAGNLILLWDGASIPSGWTDVSASGQAFYQKLLRGEATYSGTGGTASHSHTTGSGYTTGPDNTYVGGIVGGQPTQQVIVSTHTHAVGSAASSSNSAIPPYRNLKVIKYNSGIPLTIPSGAIAIFDNTVPSGWTRYSAEDNYFLRAESEANGGTGGAANHNHTWGITAGASSDWSTAFTYVSGSGVYGPLAHDHTLSGTSDSVDNSPPFITAILGKANSDTQIPLNMVGMFDASPSAGPWSVLSSSGGPFYQKFIKGSSGYGTTGGASTHTHSLTASTSPTSSTSNRIYSGSSYNLTQEVHGHTKSLTLPSVDNTPPYVNVILAKSSGGPYLNSGSLGMVSPFTGLRFGDPASTNKYKWTNVSWAGAGISSTYKAKIQARARDTWGSDGTTDYMPLDQNSNSNTVWTEITSGTSGNIPITNTYLINNFTKTLEFRVELVGDGNNTSTLYNLAVDTAPTNFITLDMIPPSDVNGLAGYDTSGKGVTLDQANWYNYNTSGTSPYFEWTAATDGNGIAGYCVYWGTNGSADPTSGCTPQSGTNFTNNTSLSPGTYYLRIKAKDNAGNYSNNVTQFTYKFDDSKPNSAVTIAPTYVGPNTYAANTINGTASDTGSGLQKTEIKIQRSSDSQYWTGSTWGSETWLNVGTGATWSYDIGTANLSDGVTYTITSNATDNAGNVQQTQSTDTFIYDSQLAGSTMTVPSTDGKYNGTSWPGSISGSASDTGSGVQKVEVRVKRSDNKYYNGPNDWVDSSNTWKQAEGTTSWSYAIAATQFTDGASYTVDSRATDNAGNVNNGFIRDSFNRANQDGWGTADSGEIWSVDSSTNWKINSNQAQGGSGPAQGTRIYENDVENSETLVKMKPYDLSYRYSGGVGIRKSTNNRLKGYYAGIYWRNDAASDFSISYMDDSGNRAAIGAIHSITLTADTYYWIKFRAVGNSLKAKIWQDGSAEPGSWSLERTDSTLSSGRFGMFDNGWGSAYYDDYQVTMLDASGDPSFDTETFTYDEASPTGTITIANNNAYTKNLNNWLQFTAAGDTQKMAVSNNAADLASITPSDPLWQNYNASLSWSLSSGADGTRTVYARFMDYATNISTLTYSDEIIYDSTPATSTVTAPANGDKTNLVTQLSGTAYDVTSGITNVSQITIAVIKNVSGTDNYWNPALNGGLGDWATDQAWFSVDQISGTKPDYTWTRNTVLPGDWATEIEKDYTIKVKAQDDATNAGTEGSVTFSYDKVNPTEPSVTSSTHGTEATWYNTNNVTISDFSSTDTYGVAGYSYAWSTEGTDPDDNLDSGAPVNYNGQADGLWYFKVKARDNAGNWSTIRDFVVRIDTAGPVAGTPAFVASGTDDTKITVSWGKYTDPNSPNSSGVKEYKVYRSTASNSPESTQTTDPGLPEPRPSYGNLVATVTDTGAENYNYEDAGLSMGWYYYRIEAWDNATSSNMSSYAYSHSKTNYIPDAISNFTVNGGTGDVTISPTASKTVTLAWTTTDPDGASDITNVKYTVTKPDGATVHSTANITCLGANCSSISNGYSVSGVSYTFGNTDAYGNYTIKAVTTDTIGGAHVINSNSVTVKLIPAASSAITIASDRSSRIDINSAGSPWTAPNSGAGVSSYKIYRRTDNPVGDDATWKTGADNVYSGANKYYQDNSVGQDYTYYYRVAAIDQSSNEGVLSSAVSVTPPKADPPINVKLIDNSQLTQTPADHRILVSWDKVAVSDVPDATGYVIYRSTDGIVYSYLTTVPSLTTNYYLDIDVNGTNTYYYQVRTYDASYSPVDGLLHQGAGDPSQASDPVSMQPGTADVIAPVITGVSTTAGVSSATITWDTSGENSDTVVNYGTTNAYGLSHGNVNDSTPSHSVILRGLNPGTTYHYNINSRDASKNLGESGDQTFTTSAFSIVGLSPGTPSNKDAIITWTTQAVGNSVVEYRASNEGSYKMAGNASESVISHSVLLLGLSNGAEYFFRARSEREEAGDKIIAQSEGIQSFVTKQSTSGQASIPAVSKVNETEVTATSVTVVWDTNIPMTSWVEYGTSTGYGTTVGDDAFNTHHVVKISGLVPETVYHYRIKGKDASGNEFISPDYTFKALATPAINDVRTSELGPYGVTITWSTNIPTDSGVSYGVSTGYGSRAGSQELTTVHVVKLTKLTDSATYHFQAEVKDARGNTAKGDDKIFTTPLDTQGPKISEAKISPITGVDESKRGLIITWVTDKEATGQVEYGAGVTPGKYESRSPIDPNYNISHTIIISDLEPGTTYHFRLISKDRRGNEGKSQDYTMLTSEKEESIFQLILKTLEETFSWVGKVRDFVGQQFGKLIGK